MVWEFFIIGISVIVTSAFVACAITLNKYHRLCSEREQSSQDDPMMMNYTWEEGEKALEVSGIVSQCVNVGGAVIGTGLMMHGWGFNISAGLPWRLKFLLGIPLETMPTMPLPTLLGKGILVMIVAIATHYITIYTVMWLCQKWEQRKITRQMVKHVLKRERPPQSR